jgi:hypothetical protein
MNAAQPAAELGKMSLVLSLVRVEPKFSLSLVKVETQPGKKLRITLAKLGSLCYSLKVRVKQ